jgi:transposase InsO family protein
MNDELAARHRAISLRLAGRPVKQICSALGRSEAWFHKWWGRYLQAGPEGLYDLTRAHHHVAQRNFNGWFQPRLFQRPTDLGQELARLQEAVNTQHVHPRLGGLTPAQHRKGLRLAKLSPGFVVPAGRLPLSAGRVIFIRRVSPAGTV